MRWTRTLIPTLKENPADAQTRGHRLMLRAGLIRQVAAGTYDFLPLGLRILHKAATIVRDEMLAAGAVEVLMPALQPLEWWQATGRDKTYGENLMTLRDRHGRVNVLGPTHEEVVTELAASAINSYKQLPLTLFQIQTKFRDEYRPRSGLLRVREFLMKDAYSFHLDLETLRGTYDFMRAAYERIFSRCGLPAVAAEAESGPIGGGEGVSHEFLVPCEAGEDVLVMTDRGHYAANLERAATGDRPWSWGGDATAPLEKVHTPGMASVEDVARFMEVEPRQVLKTLVFRTSAAGPALESGVNARWVVAVVRGDHEVNEAKLGRVARETFRVGGLHLADDADVRATWAVGFVGPHAATYLYDAVMIVDPDAAQDGPWVAGANERDHHVRGFNWFRECGQNLADPRKVIVADIRNALDGDPSPLNDGGRLVLTCGIEVGHIFQLGDKYSAALGALVQDETGTKRPVLMGCYGIGIGRILAAAAEALSDDNGLVWPAAIAPYSVAITPVRYDGATKAAADRLYDELTVAVVEQHVDARPGAKFADADLVGFPIRITVGERGLKDGTVELKQRTAPGAETVSLASVVGRMRAMLA
jgi:prolyl-tRNA synthetase